MVKALLRLSGTPGEANTISGARGAGIESDGAEKVGVEAVGAAPLEKLPTRGMAGAEGLGIESDGGVGAAGDAEPANVGAEAEKDGEELAKEGVEGAGNWGELRGRVETGKGTFPALGRENSPMEGALATGTPDGGAIAPWPENVLGPLLEAWAAENAGGWMVAAAKRFKTGAP